MFAHDVEQRLIFGFGRHDDHIVEVFGCCTDEGDAADVDFFDDVGTACPIGYGLLKGIEVYHHEVDGRDVVLCHLLTVALQISTPEDAAEHLGVERLDASAEDGGVGGEIFYLLAGQAQTDDEVVGAAGGEKGHALGMKCAEEGFESVLVKHGDERRFEGALCGGCICHDEKIL